MVKENIDFDSMSRASESIPEGIVLQDDVIVIVNQAYGPDGERLIGLHDVSFDGFPAITLRVVAGDRDELVHLSPIHGDRRKRGMQGLPKGTRCKLLSPVTGKPLDRIGPVDDSGAEYFAIYLSPKLGQGPAVYISDVWGHYHSRVVDNDELISLWAAKADRDEEAAEATK